MSEYYPDDPRFYLRREYQMRAARRPHYSLRAFARDLEISPSSLTEFLGAKYGFSRARVSELSKKLKLNASQADHFRDLMDVAFSKQDETTRLAKVRIEERVRNSPSRLSLERFEVISDWRHMAILELIDLDPKYATLNVLANALDMSESAIAEALKRLVSIGLLVNTDGVFSPASSSTFVGDDVPSEAIRLYHHRVLQSAAVALDEQELARREFSSSVFSFRREDLADLKADLKRMRLELMGKYASKSEKDSVYCLSIQLFDLLKEEGAECERDSSNS